VAWVAGASISRERRVRGTFAVVTGVFNYGFVALPLAFRFFDRQTVAVLFLFNVGVELAMWLFGMLLLSGAPAREGVRKVVNPPVCTIIVAVALTLTGIARFTPEWAMNTFDFLGRTAVPLALVLAGASMFDHIRELTGAGTLKTASLGVVLRMGFLPVLFVAAAVWIPFSLELKRVLVLQAAMPSAVFPVVMAKHYGGCTATALRVALATAIASLLATPLILRAGVLLLE
jgi:predicted permease